MKPIRAPAAGSGATAGTQGVWRARSLGGRVKAHDGTVKLVRLPFLVPRRVEAQVILPGRILVRRGSSLTPRRLAHCLVHLEQMRRLGLAGFWWSYLTLLLRHGYGEHPLELDAVVRSAEPAFLEAARSLLARELPGAEGNAYRSGRPIDVN